MLRCDVQCTLRSVPCPVSWDTSKSECTSEWRWSPKPVRKVPLHQAVAKPTCELRRLTACLPSSHGRVGSAQRKAVLKANREKYTSMSARTTQTPPKQ